MKDKVQQISRELQLSHHQVKGCLALLDEGATIPFIARYRKENTGSLDEVAISAVRDLNEKIHALTDRREKILSTLESGGVLTGELKAKIVGAETLTELEDLYLPHRPRRKTKATKAREAGLEPLAQAIYSRQEAKVDTRPFLNPAFQITCHDECLEGAADIIAEWISEHGQSRAGLRSLFSRDALLSASVISGKEEEAQKYRDYFQWEEVAKKVPGHRLLAILRAEREKLLSVKIRPPKDSALSLLARFHRSHPNFRDFLQNTIADSYKRLLGPAMERELRNELTESAENGAIEVFSSNLRQLLLSPPLGAKRVLALDPGFRTGAKLACLDNQGTPLFWTTIFPTHSAHKKEEAAKTVTSLIEKYSIEAVGIGNKTAARETEQFIRSLGLPSSLIIAMVNEDGASVYSASELARKEFPDLDITVRGAISIGRRLQDPLAELVKIDPRSIGVGQYQHDLNHKKLESALNETVMYCVNNVGVELNNASAELLTHVAGLTPALAQNIVNHRSTSGPFQKRRDLLKVKKLGPKTFEQCAGFLRINGGKEVLDSTGVHPERYKIVLKMAEDLHYTVSDLLENEKVVNRIDSRNYISAEVGDETVADILAELARPGRDPRENFSQFQFNETIHEIGDLREGMELPGIITNITSFGAFADIGIKENGLIHISQIADRFIRDPAEVVSIGQQVKARVVTVDIARKRIGLSLRTNSGRSVS